MALNRYLNSDGMKADRLNDRLKKTSIFSRRLKFILEKRYDTMSERAKKTERLVAIHEKQLARCQQEWGEGLAIQIGLSERGPKVDGRNAACITFIPTDDASEKSLKWLMETHAENRGRAHELNKRLALRMLAKDETVKKYFLDLKDDGNFVRLYGIYRSANLLVEQDASPEKISSFIERKMRVIASEPCCKCTGCLFTKVLESSMSVVFLFDIDRESGRILPRAYGKEPKSVSPERLLSDVLLDAREVDILMHALAAISLNGRDGPQNSSKEMFDRIMKTVPGVHEGKKKE
jgi:hypothetical protein